MRIFYAAPSSPYQGGLPDSKLWHVNLYLPLVDLGHDIVPFEYDYGDFGMNLDPSDPRQEKFIRENRPRLSEELIRQVREAHRRRKIDVLFSYFYAAHVESDAVRQIARLGITTVNWYCNASYQFHLVREIAPAFHYCLVPERYRLEDYRRVGATPIYCQEAANPSVYRPVSAKREFDVTFVGQKYGNRPAMIRRLIDAGIEARAWGPHWRQPDRPWLLQIAAAIKHQISGRSRRADDRIPDANTGAPLTDEEYVRMFSRSKISLGFTTLAGTAPEGGPNHQVRLRDFEAPMSGAFYLVEYFEELADFFEPGREIETFSDGDELVAKARYYLSHEAARERIRQAGLGRARREHTWQHRFETAFRQMGIS
jgi:spore maturation protein CgeB